MSNIRWAKSTCSAAVDHEIRTDIHIQMARGMRLALACDASFQDITHACTPAHVVKCIRRRPPRGSAGAAGVGSPVGFPNGNRKTSTV
jgi:hypothetical protein